MIFLLMEEGGQKYIQSRKGAPMTYTQDVTKMFWQAGGQNGGRMLKNLTGSVLQ